MKTKPDRTIGVLISIKPSLHRRAAQRAKRLYGPRSFSSHVATLLQKDLRG